MVYLRVGEGRAFINLPCAHCCARFGPVVCPCRGTMLFSEFSVLFGRNKGNCTGTMEADPASWYAADQETSAMLHQLHIHIVSPDSSPSTECEHQGVPTAVPPISPGTFCSCQPLFHIRTVLDSYQLKIVEKDG